MYIYIDLKGVNSSHSEFVGDGEFVRGDYIGVANSTGAKSTWAIDSGAKNSGRIRQATVYKGTMEAAADPEIEWKSGSLPVPALDTTLTHLVRVVEIKVAVQVTVWLDSPQ